MSRIGKGGGEIQLSLGINNKLIMFQVSPCANGSRALARKKPLMAALGTYGRNFYHCQDQTVYAFKEMNMYVQLLMGLACMEGLDTEGAESKGSAEARGCLTKAAKGGRGPVSSLAHLLLAELEASGKHKKRGERVTEHLSQVCVFQPPPPFPLFCPPLHTH